MTIFATSIAVIIAVYALWRKNYVLLLLLCAILAWWYFCGTNKYELFEGRMHRSQLSREDEKKLVELLTPVDVEGMKFERLGADADGGYVVPAGGQYDYHICLGVGGDVTFENDILGRVLNEVICFDHTVPSLPAHADDRLRWVKRGVSDKETATLTTLPLIIKNLKHYGNMSLKMDIEGWEFPVMNSLSEQDLQNFDLIVTEFHCLGNKGDGGGGDSGPIKNPKMKLKALQKLSKTHFLVHIHSTPHVLPLRLSNGTLVPYVPELTFVRKKGRQAKKTRRSFPTDLDQTLQNKAHIKNRKHSLQFI